MNFKQYENQAIKFLNPDINQSDLMNLMALGLNGQAGQVADYLKKCKYHGKIFDKENMIHELGDVLWYLVIGAQALNISLEDIAQENIKKLTNRYPNGWQKRG